MKGRKSCQGFTMIELMVTLSIASILVGVAVPSFRHAVLNGNITSARSELMADLNFARMAAVKNRTRIIVCARNSDTTCGSDWSNGWLVYDDSSSVGVSFDLDPDEEVIRLQNQLRLQDKNIDVNSTIRNQSALAQTVPEQYVFESRGRSGVSGLLVFCDERGVDEAKTIVITATGSIRTDSEFDGAGNRIDPWGGVMQCP